MVVSRYPRWISLLQHGFFVLCLATPAYLAAIRTLTSRGIGLAWYQRVGLAALCLLSVGGVMLLTGLLLVAASRIVKHVCFRLWRRA